jgi:hypothetical protein
MFYQTFIEGNCKKCGRPHTYVGDVPEGGFPKGQEPYCTCGDLEERRIEIPINNWQYCPHCGKELR